MGDTISMAILVAALGLLNAGNASGPYPPVDTLTGLDSVVDQESVELVTTQEQWNKVWIRHKGIISRGDLTNSAVDPTPPVNFQNEEVLVLFGGLAPATGYKIVDSLKTPKEIEVRIHPLVPATNPNLKIDFEHNPFLFAIYKKTRLPFALQLEEQNPNGTTQWKTVQQVGGDPQEKTPSSEG